MPTIRILATIALGALTSFAAPEAAPEAAGAPTPFISELGLRESAAPVASRSRWRRPRLIVVDAGVPGLLTGLRDVAADVEFIGVQSAPEMAAAAVRADALVGRPSLICDDAVLAAAQQLRWVQSAYDGVELCVAKTAFVQRKILLTNVRAVAGPVIAEHAMAMLLALTRGLYVFIPRQASGSWDEAYPVGPILTALQGKTMLVVGLGGIGAEVAKRANAFGMRVIATRATPQPLPPFVTYVGTPDELPKLIGAADVIVHTAPLTPATRGLYNAAMFARMKPTAIFINVARGAAVVTDDLAAALTSHRIAGAALDVVNPEPLPKDHPLWRAPNLLITPHVAAVAPGQGALVMRVLRENLRRYVAGERVLSEVDVERGY